MAFIVEHNLVTCTAIAAALAMNFGVGSVSIMIAMAKDAENDLRNFNGNVKESSNESLTVQQFKDIVRFYSDAKQLNSSCFLFIKINHIQ